jgi:hypothetical protein
MTTFAFPARRVTPLRGFESRSLRQQVLILHLSLSIAPQGARNVGFLGDDVSLVADFHANSAARRAAAAFFSVGAFCGTSFRGGSENSAPVGRTLCCFTGHADGTCPSTDRIYQPGLVACRVKPRRSRWSFQLIDSGTQRNRPHAVNAGGCWP